MNKVNEIPASELAKALNVATAYACHLRSGFRRVNAQQALIINEKFGIPLWDIRPDIYPRHLFEANDAININNQPRPIESEANE